VKRTQAILALCAVAGAFGAVVDARMEPLSAEPRHRSSGPPSRSREEARRRRQRARAGLPVVEPAPVDPSACVGAEKGSER